MLGDIFRINDHSDCVYEREKERQALMSFHFLVYKWTGLEKQQQLFSSYFVSNMCIRKKILVSVCITSVKFLNNFFFRSSKLIVLSILWRFCVCVCVYVHRLYLWLYLDGS